MSGVILPFPTLASPDVLWVDFVSIFISIFYLRHILYDTRIGPDEFVHNMMTMLGPNF
jgi:hypothetical protein